MNILSLIFAEYAVTLYFAKKMTLTYTMYDVKK